MAEAKKAAVAQPDTHDYSEAETRDYFIDLLLKEAGWPLDQPRDREFEVAGMPNNQGKGFVDYVLWGDDGKPLGLVEAKRTRRDARVGQQQAKLYADCLEAQFGRRPVIFYSNGYEHWLWDDARYPPRAVQGFYKKAELELAVQRRSTRKRLATGEINSAIVERYYQTRGIRRIAEVVERDHERKALVVMATGAGKTRTVIALCRPADALQLGQAGAVPGRPRGAGEPGGERLQEAPARLRAGEPGHREGRRGPRLRLHLPDDDGPDRRASDGRRRFGVGHFDLVIIDEAHRSVFQKYRAIFDYFDALLVGLTATPKDEVDRNTYGLFDLENGVPTDAYALEEAVQATASWCRRRRCRCRSSSSARASSYKELVRRRQGAVGRAGVGRGRRSTGQVEAEAVNKWLFNKDTVDKVLEHLMTRGQKSGRWRPARQDHHLRQEPGPRRVHRRALRRQLPALKGEFARVITFKTEYAQSLIDDFSTKDKAPHIAISVDMLDTGIDVPEVVNLVFFKLVRSKTKFWQMVGRGTRLCPDLFGPGKPKEHFYLFDYCQNLEFFSQNPATDGALGESLGKRLFKARGWS